MIVMRMLASINALSPPIGIWNNYTLPPALDDDVQNTPQLRVKNNSSTTTTVV